MRNRGKAQGKTKINKDGEPKNKQKIKRLRPARGFGTFAKVKGIVI